MVQFGPFVDADFLKAGADGWVIHFGRASRVFRLPICDAKPVIKELVVEPLDGYIGETVDCRRQNRATIILKVLGEIRSSAQKTDAHRRLGNNHSIPSLD